jgi:hypothetical protein
VNQFIDAAELLLQYCTVDDVGEGVLMGKCNIKSALRPIMVRKSDWPLLGFQIDGEFFFDVKLLFGCRSSPFLFSHFAEAIHWIVTNSCHSFSMLHYVDDFLMVGRPDTDECQKLMLAMVSKCGELGVPLAL